MANKIVETNLDPLRFVPVTSRYSKADVIQYGDLNRLTFTTYKRAPFVLGTNDKFMVIGKGSEYRPDLISNQVYGVVDFWWRIMEYNQIYDIMDFRAGTNIRIPALTLQ